MREEQEKRIGSFKLYFRAPFAKAWFPVLYLDMPIGTVGCVDIYPGKIVFRWGFYGIWKRNKKEFRLSQIEYFKTNSYGFLMLQKNKHIWEIGFKGCPPVQLRPWNDVLWPTEELTAHLRKMIPDKEHR